MDDEDLAREVLSEKYKGYNIESLWKEYIDMEDEFIEYRQKMLAEEIKHSQLELKIVIELMSKFPKETRERFCEELNNDYIHKRAGFCCSNNIRSNIRRISLYKSEILHRSNKNEI